MIAPVRGRFLFDTSAESWLARSEDATLREWFHEYLSLYPAHVSAITVLERIRGYAVIVRRSPEQRRESVEAARATYLSRLGFVWPVDAAIAVVAAEIMALLPHPSAPLRRTHRQTESRQERLARWRFDCIIAATALVVGMALIHNNAADFESIRGAIERSPERFPKLGPLELLRCESLVN
jgi:predicted nucleic acid-binding protein